MKHHHHAMSPPRPPLLVIVTGLPCTGKTTLAHRLAREIPLPIIAKDDIKEGLFDTLGWSDREWSRKLGLAAITLIYQLVEKLLGAGVPVIAESYFHPDLAPAEFAQLYTRAPYRPFIIECIADGEVLMQRWRSRLASGERHPGHVDETTPEEKVGAVLLPGRAAPRLEIGAISPGWGSRVIDTTDFSAIPYDSLVEEIRANL